MALHNFRDLGGIPTIHGTVIRSGLFFRGGPLADLNSKETAFIDSLDLKVILDFRSKRELARVKPEYVPKGCHLEQFSATKLVHETRKDDLDMTDPGIDLIEEWLKLQYRDLPLENPAYQYMLDCLRKGDLPIYFHCMSGKDRTGVGAALIEYLLDVSLDEIFRDYLRSYEEMLKINPNAHRPSLVFREWLEGSFEEIDSRYQTRDDFFAQEYGILPEERRHLIALYTE